jgi:hypothetical protein
MQSGKRLTSRLLCSMEVMTTMMMIIIIIILQVYLTIHYDVGPNLGTTAYVTTSNGRNNYYYIITIIIIIIIFICELGPVAVLYKA